MDVASWRGVASNLPRTVTNGGLRVSSGATQAANASMAVLAKRAAWLVRRVSGIVSAQALEITRARASSTRLTSTAAADRPSRAFSSVQLIWDLSYLPPWPCPSRFRPEWRYNDFVGSFSDFRDVITCLHLHQLLDGDAERLLYSDRHLRREIRAAIKQCRKRRASHPKNLSGIRH